MASFITTILIIFINKKTIEIEKGKNTLPSEKHII
jgi:hypothetical protein